MIRVLPSGNTRITYSSFRSRPFFKTQVSRAINTLNNVMAIAIHSTEFTEKIIDEIKNITRSLEPR